MHSEVNQESKNNELGDLKKQLKTLKEKNKENIKTKRNFEEELEAYINHILYEKNFFKKSKNTKYRDDAKLIYEKYQGFIKDKKWEDLQYYEQLVLNFIQKNQLIEIKEIEIKENEPQSYVNQEVDVNDFKFIQLKTLMYKLTWKKAEIKEYNKKNEDKKDYNKLTENIKIVK